MKDKSIGKKTVINEPISHTALDQSVAPAGVDAKAGNQKAVKQVTGKQVKGNKNNKENIFVRMGKRIARAFKEMGSELKKVSWPTFPKAAAATGVVLCIVVIFLLILTGMDALLGLGFKALIGIA